MNTENLVSGRTDILESFEVIEKASFLVIPAKAGMTRMTKIQNISKDSFLSVQIGTGFFAKRALDSEGWA